MGQFVFWSKYIAYLFIRRPLNSLEMDVSALLPMSTPVLITWPPMPIPVLIARPPMSIPLPRRASKRPTDRASLWLSFATSGYGTSVEGWKPNSSLKIHETRSKNFEKFLNLL